MFRIGYGVDFHQLVEGRPFMLGGVQVPHHKGALGHSDADVLLHAICDALLGAINAGDIGKHFPDTDATYSNIDSKILLKKCYELVGSKGYELVNMDTTLCLQAPKIISYIPAMQLAIANCMNVSEELISIKATTTEKLGFVGREEGVVAYAAILLKKII